MASERKRIHLKTEQYRIIGLAETAANEGDSEKAYTLLAVASALGAIPTSTEGFFTTYVEELTA